MTPREILLALIRLPSVNPMGGEVRPDIRFERRMSDWLERYFDSIGCAHERIEVEPGRDNLIARYQANDSKPTILLDAHQDTVPAVGMEQPFEPQVRDGRIFGRGACDVKGGMAAMLYAFTRLISERPGDSANVILSCSCDEEAGMAGVRQLVSNWESAETKSQLLRSQPDVCVVAEPTELDIVTAHLGVIRFRVRTSGSACHASTPNQGKNAIYAMAPVIEFLQAEAARLATDSNAHPLCGRPTLSVGKIVGGTSVNIVPDECLIEIDRRLVPTEDPVGVWKSLKRGLEEFDDTACDPPWLAAPALSDLENADLSSQLAAAIESVGMENADQVGVAYCTNGSTIAAGGVPTVVFGPGSIAQAHTVNEYIDLEQLETAARIYYEFCANYS